MAKEADDKLKDDVVIGQEAEDDIGQDEQQEAPKDIRGAIKAAFKEAEGKDDEGQEDKDPEDKKIVKRTTVSKSKAQTKEEGDDTDSEISEGDDSGENERKEKPEEKVEIPPYYKNKGKAVWDKLTPEDKKLIVAREKEVSDGFKQNSTRLQGLEEVERAIAPRLQAIQRFGTTPGQTVDRLFQWMEALSNPDANARANSFKQLANSFGVDVAQLSPKSTGSENSDVGNSEVVDQTANEPPAWATQVAGKVTALEAQLANQQQAAAEAAITSWASAKSSDGALIRPHYSKVNQLMYQLMISNAVPMKDGNLDLDGAYEAACKLNPEVSALIQQEQKDKQDKESKEKATQNAQLAKARLAKARNAGSGLKPAAASMPMASVKGKANGSGEDTSVRNSIRKSLQELRE